MTILQQKITSQTSALTPLFPWTEHAEFSCSLFSTPNASMFKILCNFNQLQQGTATRNMSPSPPHSAFCKDHSPHSSWSALPSPTNSFNVRALPGHYRRYRSPFTSSFPPSRDLNSCSKRSSDSLALLPI